MIRDPGFDERLGKPERPDPELVALFSGLNESLSGDEGSEAGDDDGGEAWKSVLDRSVSRKPVARPGVSVFKPQLAAATSRKRDLPEELEALERSLPSALFPGLTGPQPERASTQAGIADAGTGDGRTSRASLATVLALALFMILGVAWYGSHVDIRIGELEMTLSRLNQRSLESQTALEKSEQKLGNIVRVQQQNARSIQKVERTLAELKQSAAADIEILGAQIEDLREVETADEMPVPAVLPPPIAALATFPPVATPEPAPTWGVNLASHASRETAMREMERIRGTGIEVVVRPVEVAEKRWYRLRVSGLPDRKVARVFLRQHREHPDFSGAWISNEP